MEKKLKKLCRYASLYRIGKSHAITCEINNGEEYLGNNNCIASSCFFDGGIGRPEVTNNLKMMRQCSFRVK